MDAGVSTSWPTVDILRQKGKKILKELRISKVEYATDGDGDIVSLRFTLNDGEISNQIGL